MRARRAPSAPPQIPGYEYVRVLGLGGFADVFEYRQELPHRSVAVKVLLASSLDEATRQRFFAEANLMAQLSHHPSIVTIYHADIAQDGRPFLVMEYCSRAGLGARYRAERITVAEVLRTGIRLASAVEAAHRQGILHRDIKPANILTTDYGWPALTDFGIAATTGGDSAAGTGMSIPWSPPELLADTPVGDQRGDVYSLAATIYSMLAGRSPFEVAGQPNGAADLISRIERSPLPTLERDDATPALQAVLARAMSKDPARRYDSALAVARALQQVERSLGLSVTSIELFEDLVERPAPVRRAPIEQEGEATRLRPIVSIDPVQPAVSTVPTAGSASSVAVQAPAWVGAPPALPAPGYLAPPPLPAGSFGAPAPTPAPRPAPRRRRTLALVVSGLVVLGMLATAAYLAWRGEDEVAPTPTPEPTTTTSLDTGAVPAPTELAAEVADDGAVTFTWVNPQPQEGDTYLWAVVRPGAEREYEVTNTRTVTVPPEAGAGSVCLEVSIVRADRRASTQPAEVCS
ncbi:MAG: serine/threonine-protein kinase [Cellulomonadaceae bacterium]